MCLIALANCKKFEDDPFISGRTVEARMEGEWKIERLTLKGEDIIPKYNDTIAPKTFGSLKVFIRINEENHKYRNRSDHIKYNSLGMRNMDTINGMHCALNFDFKGSKIIFKKTGYGIMLGKYSKIFLDESEFTIKRLYGEVLVLQNSLYEIKLVK